MAPRVLLGALVAALVQGTLCHQHLCLYGPREWTKVKSVEYKIERHDKTGYNPNQEGWSSTAWQGQKDTFAYSIAVQRNDKVTVRVATTDGATSEDSQVIGDVRSAGANGISHRWNIGGIPLFSHLENVRHADVWKDFVKKLGAVKDEDITGQMPSLFQEADEAHHGWHVVLFMDGVPSDSVDLTYTVAGGGVKTTTKRVVNKGVFAAWSVEGVAGQLEVSMGGAGKMTMPIQNTQFHGDALRLPDGHEAHVYVLPFSSHSQSDSAWRDVMGHYLDSAGAHKYWDDSKTTWKAAALEQLAGDIVSGKVVAVAATESAPPPATASPQGGVPLKMVVSVCLVAAVLMASGYYFCCSEPAEEEVEADSTTQSNDAPNAPSMLGDHWPQESVRELVPPAAATA